MMKKIDRTGYIIPNPMYGDIKVIRYKNKRNCDIQFQDGYIKKDVDYDAVVLCKVKNPYFRSVYGVGYLGEGKYLTCINKIIQPSYMSWTRILKRSYCDIFHSERPTYKDCSVDERWHNFQVFAEWFEENYNPETMQGWHLDKDLLSQGEKIYSPETCLFLPHEVNKLFIKNESTRGDYPMGVRKVGNIYEVRLKFINKSSQTKRFQCVEKAFKIYKENREKRFKDFAEKWKNEIDPRAYTAMYNYTIKITD